MRCRSEVTAALHGSPLGAVLGQERRNVSRFDVSWVESNSPHLGNNRD